MDYIGLKCPVCEKYFHADDDIVVCPDCGTPHHRECYESEGHCHNEELHGSGYDFSAGGYEKKNVKKCRSCGKENDAESFFCKYCGAQLSDNNTDRRPEDNIPPTGIPNFGAGGYPLPFMDPLGGVPKDTDLGDGVTAGEAAKYVKQNTPYFVRVFSNIKSFNRSKFNFSAALFSGGYMLYRKMYKLGAVLTALQAAGMIITTFISAKYTAMFNELAQLYYNATSADEILDFISTLGADKLFALYIPSVLSIIQIVIMITCGMCFNRMYMKHCKREIIKIKSEAKEDENPETLLQTKGGVNVPLAVSLLITNLIINYLPGIISGLL